MLPIYSLLLKFPIILNDIFPVLMLSPDIPTATSIVHAVAATFKGGVPETFVQTISIQFSMPLYSIVIVLSRRDTRSNH